jgi:DNA mismatch repair protein MutS
MPPASQDSAVPTPPMLKHWREVKAQHRDTILFYRVGDFYEMFHEDAELAAKILDIALTSRGDGVPLAGVPVKAAAEYLRQLVGAGHRVAICEQVEDPKAARGLVRREVVETLTPGALLQDGWVAGARNNWMVGIKRGSGEAGKRGGHDAETAQTGLAAIDLSTGEFILETVSGDALVEALGRLCAAEIVTPCGSASPLPSLPARHVP